MSEKNNNDPSRHTTGWVARDSDGYLALFTGDKPVREVEYSGGVWLEPDDMDGRVAGIPVGMFPSLTWHDEPLAVEITLKPINL